MLVLNSHVFPKCGYVKVIVNPPFASSSPTHICLNHNKTSQRNHHGRTTGLKSTDLQRPPTTRQLQIHIRLAKSSQPPTRRINLPHHHPHQNRRRFPILSALCAFKKTLNINYSISQEEETSPRCNGLRAALNLRPPPSASGRHCR